MPAVDRHRVVVTGMGIASPVGNDPRSAFAALRRGASGIRAQPDWRPVPGLNAHVAGVVTGLDLKVLLPRKTRRTMGRVAQLATYATGEAIRDAKLSEDLLRSGRLGVAIGSTTGSTAATLDYYANILGAGIRANKGTAFLRIMSHTAAANVALAFGVIGRVWGPSAACASGSQSIGLGYETLQAGLADVMICGGAEEAHYTAAATFDLIGAASAGFNDRPEATPRPFDTGRDGMVVGEGAGILVLERLEHARARGACAYAEVVGFATTCDAEHITSPEPEGMAFCMREALVSAGAVAADVHYVNAHATGTVVGDRAEAKATAAVFGDRVPVSSTKGHTGHTLGACGGIESIFAISMLQAGEVIPTKNLVTVDPECAGIWLPTAPLARELALVMNNNFAFGGINTSLLFRRAERG
ncbi:MAG: beta-ketoacyl-ACP synthase [Deltaproteobacteria bacterium]|nr:beta-ketoacyl-ACP synthase [Deltaproteobacteria bacterium]